MTSLKTYFVAAAMLAAATLAVACQTSTAPVATQPPGSVLVSAHLNKFDQQSVAAPADAGFTIWFENRENVPHNVRVADAAGATIGAPIEIFNGPAAREMAVPALTAGTYRLLCDVHPDMTAELVAGN